MPIQPNLLERAMFYQLNMAPGPLLDLAGALSYQTLATASQLGLFQILHSAPKTPAQISAGLESDEHGIRALLKALEAIGYVREKNGRYRNTAMTDKWLVGESFFDMASAVRYWNAAINELWPLAAEVIRTGQRPYRFYDWIEASPEFSAAFQGMMVTNAKLTGEDIADKLELPPSAGRLLDVGGGHGMFSILFCKKYPNLQATVLDSPAALATAHENVAQYGMAERVELREGDLWQSDWGQGYDCILLFNLLHHFDLDANTELLRLAAGALKPGGKVAIEEQIEGKVFGEASNAFVQLIALQYYLFADGRIYSANEIEQLLTQTGFKTIRFHSLAKAPGTTLAVADKADE